MAERTSPPASGPPDRPWLMRTYSGHSSAKASNELYRENLARGQTGLSVAFDLPTQIGYDADHPLAAGEVGRVGGPIAHRHAQELLPAGGRPDQLLLQRRDPLRGGALQDARVRRPLGRDRARALRGAGSRAATLPLRRAGQLARPHRGAAGEQRPPDRPG